MATMALPIRELSASVECDAASAQKTVLKVLESVSSKRTDVLIWMKTRQLDHKLVSLIDREQDLITKLQNLDTSALTTDWLEKFACDLDRIVSLTESMVDDMNEMPPRCVNVWSPKLKKLDELARYIDNIAESFHVAADPECATLLSVAAEYA
ncbi:MAG: hypothetical protein ACHP78_11490 [Terriglobales bacterium]